ncbi:MAG TPA: response regulator [Blastocatellia bacterium]|nr:response regulator [Blastocatellia bacterium]
MKSMLIIDSSEIIARLYTDVFERRSWNVAVCADQRAALNRLAGDDRYDAVVLGYHVPGTDGAGLVKFLRSLEHRRTTAVVMVTGDDHGKEAGLAAGADEVLIRPVNPYALIWAVDKHVR